jgi:mRNA interferase MazF
VIVQSDSLLALSTIVICPTSQSAPSASFHPEIDLDEEPTKVLCEMAGAVDGGHLGDQVGHLTVDEMAAVDDALALVLGLA